MFKTHRKSTSKLQVWMHCMLTFLLVVSNFAAVKFANAAPAQQDSQPSFPIRAAFYYPWFPESWSQQGFNPFTNYNPSLGFYNDGQAVTRKHIESMQYGGIQAGIASWWGQGSSTDGRIDDLLQAASGTSFRWAIYYEPEGQGNPSVKKLKSDLTYLRDKYGNDPSFLRVNGRFVVFVYADGKDSCGMANRWKKANTVGAYLVLKVFSGYRKCPNQPDGWHQYGPAAATDHQKGYSYTIAPGLWKKGSPVRLERDLNRWHQNIRDMIASGAPWHLITTFNEWGAGTSVESAKEWETGSGYGAYLDALHNNGSGGPAPATKIPPTLPSQPTATIVPPTKTSPPTATSLPPTQTSQPTATLVPPTQTVQSNPTSLPATQTPVVTIPASQTSAVTVTAIPPTNPPASQTSAVTVTAVPPTNPPASQTSAATVTAIPPTNPPASPTRTYTAIPPTNPPASPTRTYTAIPPTNPPVSTATATRNPAITPTVTPVPTFTASPIPSPTRTSPPNPSGDPVIGAAGDIACDPTSSSFNGGNGTGSSCRQKAVSDVMLHSNLTSVLILGDAQYDDGTLAQFQQSYDLSWGRLKSITRPAPGNHEYGTAGASGYFSYFGAAAGDRTKGYYSYNLGAWHIIALNSNCSNVGGCGVGSPQEQWLKADLAANRTMCTLAYFHHPRFSSGRHGNNTSFDAFWRALYAAGVEVVLNGHDHNYERFAPQSPSAAADPRGIQQFVVGTGGKNHAMLVSVQPNSVVRNGDTFGFLKLTLHGSSYDWQFVPEPGKTFTDTGTRNCFTPSSTAQTSQMNAVVPTPTAAGMSLQAPDSTLPPNTDPLAFTPTADAYITADIPNTNFGASNMIRVDANPAVSGYLTFNVQGLNAPVAQAQLKIYANSSAAAGFKVFAVPDTGWGEGTITFSNAPPLGSEIGSTGAFRSSSWVTVDVTPLVTGNGTFSLAITGLDADAINLASRESSFAPQLIITTR